MGLWAAEQSLKWVLRSQRSKVRPGEVEGQRVVVGRYGAMEVRCHFRVNLLGWGGEVEPLPGQLCVEGLGGYGSLPGQFLRGEGGGGLQWGSLPAPPLGAMGSLLGESMGRVTVSLPGHCGWLTRTSLRWAACGTMMGASSSALPSSAPRWPNVKTVLRLRSGGLEKKRPALRGKNGGGGGGRPGSAVVGQLWGRDRAAMGWGYGAGI